MIRPAVAASEAEKNMSDSAVADTRRLNSKPQDLTDAYGPPSNFLEIDVYDPQTIGVGRNRFTTYEVRMRATNRVARRAAGEIGAEFGAGGGSQLGESRKIGAAEGGRRYLTAVSPGASELSSSFSGAEDPATPRVYVWVVKDVQRVQSGAPQCW
ncbi:sorting nexin-12 isoform X1, partial [Arapaima gigas]